MTATNTALESEIERQNRQNLATVGFIEIAKNYQPGAYLEKELAAANAAAWINVEEMRQIASDLSAAADLATQIRRRAAGPAYEAPITEPERATLRAAILSAGQQAAGAALTAYLKDLDRRRVYFDPNRTAQIYAHAVTAAANFQALSEESFFNAATPAAPLWRMIQIYERLSAAAAAAKEAHQSAANEKRIAENRSAERRAAAAAKRRKPANRPPG